jgi:DNA-binding GntR family transcriptional regulator
MADSASPQAKSLDTINPRPLHEEVANRLRELIVRGDIAPGERLNERQLTERFGISRTPLREAVKLLSAEGLVKLMPNRGAVVVVITRADVEDMFQLIGVLETLGGQLACERASDKDIAEIAALQSQMRLYYEQGNVTEYFDCKQRIHQRMIECAGNRELVQAYRRVAARIRCPRFNSNFPAPHWGEAMDEDEQIFDALTARNSEQLKALISVEISNRSKIVQEWLAAREAQAKSPSG